MSKSNMSKKSSPTFCQAVKINWVACSPLNLQCFNTVKSDN